MENIFTVCEVPRVKGCKNDKMLKPQLDSNCLKFGGSCAYPHYRQLPGPPLLEGPVPCGADGDEGRRDATYFVCFIWLLEQNLTENDICLL